MAAAHPESVPLGVIYVVPRGAAVYLCRTFLFPDSLSASEGTECVPKCVLIQMKPIISVNGLLYDHLVGNLDAERFEHGKRVVIK